MAESALVIGNGIISGLIKNYVDKVDFILVLDNHLHEIEQYIPLSKVNAILGDFDTLNHLEGIQTLYPAIQIIPAPDQNDTDFDKGLLYLIENGYSKIFGFGLTGNRMDHTFNNIASLAKYDENIFIQLIDDYSKIECIPCRFSRYYAENTIISLLPIGKVDGIVTENLKYPLFYESLELGIRSGSSNSVLQNGMVSISYTAGKLVLMECWDK